MSRITMHPLRSRPVLISAAAVVFLVLAGTWIFLGGDQADRPRLLDEAALSELPDVQLEQRLVNELAQRIAYAGYSDDGWRRLGETAQRLWAVAAVEEEVFDHGVGRLLADQARGDRGPSLSDAREAYVVMHLPEVAEAVTRLQTAIADDAAKDALIATYIRIARQPDIHAKRIAFLRAHLADLAHP